MGNWGDENDFEAKALKEYEGRFTINFKKIFVDVDEISEKTLEVTDKHPKDSLLKLWAGTMIGFFILFLISYQVFALVTIPFMAFYLLALLRVFKAWISFKYKGSTFCVMSFFSLVLLFAIAQVIQHFVIGG
ncbi:hypothetical protein [Butyrivibrio sp. NC3005]|jgi:hypothetical protein|uniref:hypothetical protein n=1 Tax=Butyrivibrio sp. NC3005 TaxID=1280685 RepID=UPI0004039720|nr:hypothetical protein [Butyrivibrio sp. NC3005]